jgi:pSer/pThr/pTyr-binding forkhead associated (FHA) protein
MDYSLTVTCGADAGRSFEIASGPCTIGRAPSCAVVLSDDSVAWEHAVVTADNGLLQLQNLSALGVRVRGRKVEGWVRLRARDEIELSERCALRVEQRRTAASAGGPTGLTKILVASIVLLLAVAGGAALWVGRSAPPERPVTADQWRLAYNRIEQRLADWHERGWFPTEGLAAFREAWRLEQAGDAAAAADHWEAVRSLLLPLPLPGGVNDERTITQAAGVTRKALEGIMGRDPEAGGTDPRWSTDESVADALVWFVRYRARIARHNAGP